MQLDLITIWAVISVIGMPLILFALAGAQARALRVASEIASLRAELHLFQVQVAEKYATHERFDKLRAEMQDHFEKIDKKFDKLFETFISRTDVLTRQLETQRKS